MRVGGQVATKPATGVEALSAERIRGREAELAELMRREADLIVRELAR